MSNHSWGKLATQPVRASELTDRNLVGQTIRGKHGLAHGMGRSYGDVALADQIWLTTSLDRFISFDEKTGILEAESGVTLGAIQHLFVKLGWLLPVTPGTQYVTLGGAIANDVHGKNHHTAGTFGEHVIELTLARTNGETQTLTPKDPLFRATIGGLGLTGVIVSAKVQLKKVPGPWIASEVLPFKNVSEFFKLSAESDHHEYTVAWFDCTDKNGRGLFTRGNHTASSKPVKNSRRINFPFTPPFSLMNRLTLKPLNAAYYALGKLTAGTKNVHFEPFFYPLDQITNWNRAYGPKGFYQHQCVLPKKVCEAALDELLAAIRKHRAGSLLAVLKTTAARKNPGLLTFPIEGVTLALDFPNQGAKTQKLLAELESIVIKHGGRLNPSKDGSMSAQSFGKSFSNFKEFAKYRDPGITSRFIERVTKEKP
jgi:FAD/FMN-containing dehydrogenase